MAIISNDLQAHIDHLTDAINHAAEKFVNVQARLRRGDCRRILRDTYPTVNLEVHLRSLPLPRVPRAVHDQWLRETIELRDRLIAEKEAQA